MRQANWIASKSCSRNRNHSLLPTIVSIHPSLRRNFSFTARKLSLSLLSLHFNLHHINHNFASSLEGSLTSLPQTSLSSPVLPFVTLNSLNLTAPCPLNRPATGALSTVVQAALPALAARVPDVTDNASYATIYLVLVSFSSTTVALTAILRQNEPRLTSSSAKPSIR